MFVHGQHGIDFTILHQLEVDGVKMTAKSFVLLPLMTKLRGELYISFRYAASSFRVDYQIVITMNSFLKDVTSFSSYL